MVMARSMAASTRLQKNDTSLWDMSETSIFYLKVRSFLSLFLFLLLSLPMAPFSGPFPTENAEVEHQPGLPPRRFAQPSLENM